MTQRKLLRTDYYVAWICPVASLELLPSRLMLDEEHQSPSYDTQYDDNTYICGTLAGHNIVLATCPQGMTGNVNAGRLTGSLFKTFPNIKMAVLVGIGGGVPRPGPPSDPVKDVHLGDVVIGWPGDGKPACVYFESGRTKVDGEFEILGMMDKPDRILLNALAVLASDHELGKTNFASHLGRLQSHTKFTHPGLEYDLLFQSHAKHIGEYGSSCDACCRNPFNLVRRPPRNEEHLRRFFFHQGRIATGNSVIQDGARRDDISKRCDGVLCIEMEAAGVEVNRQCLVIRGISDYADSHKNDVWRSYAAGNAAVFARELLSRIQPSKVPDMKTMHES